MGSYVVGRLYDLHLDMGSRVLTAAELPADWRAEMERRIAAIKANRESANGAAEAPPPVE